MDDLIERDAVIKQIAETQDKVSSGIEDVTFYRAIKIIRNATAVNRLIPCSERLPEAYTQVLCYCRSGDFRIMEYGEQDGRWYDGIHDYRKHCVTYWMPLPEPPKE